MSATNKTTNIELPLFIGTDVPSWLTDWNGAMTSIDSHIATVASDASGAAATAEAASESAAQTAQGLVTANNNVSNLQQTVNNIVNELQSGTFQITAAPNISLGGGNIYKWGNAYVVRMKAAATADMTATITTQWGGYLTPFAYSNDSPIPGLPSATSAMWLGGCILYSGSTVKACDLRAWQDGNRMYVGIESSINNYVKNGDLLIINNPIALTGQFT